MKLFVADIDGTLYWYNEKNNTGVSDSCRCAIKTWLEAGHQFAVATARVYTMRDYTISDLGFSVDYLGGNGAEIVYRDGTECLHTVPFAWFLEIGKWLDEHGYDATLKVCADKQFVSYRQDQYPFTFNTRMRNNLRKSVPYKSRTITSDSKCVNMSVLTHPSITKEVERRLAKKFDGRCQVIATDRDNIDFIPLDVGKDKAIVDLASYYGISLEDVIVIGDAANDLCMFELTENSYCMSHSDVEIQKKASFVVDHVEEALKKELKKVGL